MNFKLFKTIRLQLLILFLLFTLITLIVSIYCFSIYQEREKSANLKSLIENTSARILLLNKLQLQFILYDSKNNSFYSNSTSIYLSKHKALLNEINKELNLLRTSNTDLILTQDIDKLTKELLEYKNDFRLLISKIQLRGHRDYGLEGLMREYIHKVELHKNSIDMVLLLTIRRNEKDYILRKDTSYIHKLKSNILLLKEHIKNDQRLSLSKVQELELLINNYESCFLKWIEIDREIGTDQNYGLFSKLKKHNEVFESIIGNLLNYTKKTNMELSKTNTIVFISSICFSILLGIILSIILSKKFTKPIVLLSESMADSVNNNFSNSSKLPIVKSENEIGTLIVNFNWMIERIRLYIEEIKKNEQTINEQDKKFRAMIENSNDAIALITISGKITYASPSTEKIIGYTPEELIDKSTLDLVHNDDLGNLKNLLLEVVNTPGKVSYIQFRIHHKDDSWRWIDGYISNLLNEPSVEAIIINYRDVTSRKNNELKIEEQYKELQKINSELDRFVYSASHDLKAPLTSILGMVNVSRLEPDNQSKIKYLDMAEINVKKLLNIIKELTSFSRNNRTEIEYEDINFQEIVRDQLESLSHLNNINKIDFRITIDSTIHFKSDSLRIKTLLSNLLSNAIIYQDKHQPNPYIEVTIQQKNEGVYLLIKDNGEGIAPEFQSKIFNMFYRASENSEGSGLGLYIVKGVIEKLEGNLQMKSYPGIGTEFQIELPLLTQQKHHEKELHSKNHLVY